MRARFHYKYNIFCGKHPLSWWTLTTTAPTASTFNKYLTPNASLTLTRKHHNHRPCPTTHYPMKSVIISITNTLRMTFSKMWCTLKLFRIIWLMRNKNLILNYIVVQKKPKYQSKIERCWIPPVKIKKYLQGNHHYLQILPNRTSYTLWTNPLLKRKTSIFTIKLTTISWALKAYDISMELKAYDINMELKAQCFPRRIKAWT